MFSQIQNHLGQCIWLAKETYLLASHNIKITTKQKFVRKILIAVFGYDVLATSIITGRASNRNRENEKPSGALDPIKLRAVKGADFNVYVNSL